MVENIFIIVDEFLSKYKEKKINYIKINYPIKKQRILKKSFDLFLYEKKTTKLYYLKGLIANKINDKLWTGIDIQFKNGYFNFDFVNSYNIEEIEFEELNNLYPKKHRRKLGNHDFSMKSIINKMNRTYYNILIDEENFNYNSKSYIKDQVLYDNQIIPLNKNNKVYGNIIKEMDEFIISLTNDKMLEFDLLFLENKNDMYKPYIYEIILDERSNKIMKDISYDEETLYEVLFISKEEIKKTEGIVLSGELMFSASPFITKGVYIVFNNHLVAEDITQHKKQQLCYLIKRKQTLYNNANVMNNFLNLTSNIENITIKIFDTGQANWVHIDIFDNNKNLVNNIVYDIGIGSHADNMKRNSICSFAVKEIKQNTVFILSHWDVDHISGISQLEEEQFKTLWVAPQLPENPTFSALRLAAYLEVNPDITSCIISESCNNSVVYTNPYLKIGKGKGNGPNSHVSFTKNNNLGLVLSVNNNEKALLTGDCEYIEIPNGLLNNVNPYEYLIVSHHGANIKQNTLYNHLGISSPNTRKAVVCVGKNSNYPKEGHVHLLNQIGYSVMETRNSHYPNPIIFTI